MSGIRSDRPSGHVRGWGTYVPERFVSNDELGEHIGVAADWIEQRTGIRSRHIATEDETVTYMATRAARAALERARIEPSEIDLVLLATTTASELTPASANRIQGELGASRAAAMQIESGCTGFVCALVTAEQFIANGSANRVLVVASERLSPWLDWGDPATCSLFGDAAAAIVLVGDAGPGGVLSHTLGSDGARADFMTLPMPPGRQPPFMPQTEPKTESPCFEMAGMPVARFAVAAFARTLAEILEAANRSLDDLALVIPHQANPRIVQMAVRNAGIPMSKVFSNADRYGNTSATSVPLALARALETGAAGPGDLVALVAFGAGLAWGGALLELTQAEDS